MMRRLRWLFGIALLVLSVNQARLHVSFLPVQPFGNEFSFAVADSTKRKSWDHRSYIAIHNVSVAYVISITACEPTVLDGAAVLAESIADTQKQKYQLVALVFHQEPAASCRYGLEYLGYKVLLRSLPFADDELKYQTRKYIKQGGCCGATEYLKLHAFNMVEFDVVVHLDVDVLLLKPLDPLIKLLVQGRNSNVSIRTIPLDAPIPPKPDFLFVREYHTYNNVDPTNRYKNGIQGAFFLIKPSVERYEDLIRVLRSANFDRALGWESKFGGYWGSAQIQGFLSYYYYAINKLASSIELDHCRYNTLGHDLRYLPEPNLTSTCRTGETTCEDCSLTPFDEIYVAHLSLCKKPFWCPNRLIKERVPLCGLFYAKWFFLRRQVDRRLFGEEIDQETNSDIDNEYVRVSLGFCSGTGKEAYRPLQWRSLMTNQTELM